jgi:hypothetical protein
MFQCVDGSISIHKKHGAYKTAEHFMLDESSMCGAKGGAMGRR